MESVIEIRSILTEKVVDTINVSGHSIKSIDRIERGANINLNHNIYYTQVTHSKP